MTGSTPRLLAPICLLAGLSTLAQAAHTNNIMLTGYWPPTNNMVRRFSDNPVQNPDGWIGGNWENRGYDVYSFFPEFPDGQLGKGEGDFEVDYQDTSSDFWRIVAEVQPVAIITFSRASARNPPRWEVEHYQRNLQTWVNDYQAPRQPTPSPPDASVPAGYVRNSSLPMQGITDAVNAANLGIQAFISDNNGGGFLSEFMAYHGTWYHDLHADPSDAAWNVAAGHVHVDYSMSLETAIAATDITLRTVIGYVDSQLPEPTTGAMLLAALAGMARRRRVVSGPTQPTRRVGAQSEPTTLVVGCCWKRSVRRSFHH